VKHRKRIKTGNVTGGWQAQSPQTEQVPFPLHIIIIYSADSRLYIGTDTAYSRKIMGTHKGIRSSLHNLLIQVLGIKPGTIHVKRVFKPGIINEIGIFLLCTRTDGIKRFVNLKSLGYHNIRRQMGI
jgi:hypothetical protein